MGVCASAPVSAEEAAERDRKKLEKVTSERERIEAKQEERRRKSRSNRGESTERVGEPDMDDDEELEAMGIA